MRGSESSFEERNREKPDYKVTFGDKVGRTFRDMKDGIVSLFEPDTPEEKEKKAEEAKGLEAAKKREKERHERNKMSPAEQEAARKADLDPATQAKDVQEHNKAVEGMSDEQKKALDLPEHAGEQHAYDPGDTNGDGVEVSKEKGNQTDTDNLKQFGMAAEAGQGKDYYKDTKAAWDHLTSVFGDRVSALQNEIEGRLSEMATPTDRETGNPFAGDDVPASKEMDYGDFKGAIQKDVDDAKAVMGGIGDVGLEGLKTAGAAVKDTGGLLADKMGYNSKDLDDAKQTLKDVGSLGKSLSGLGGLFATDNSKGDSKVPDGNWKPKSINDLFK